jgi:acid phosphatase family membrane protein YuiD
MCKLLIDATLGRFTLTRIFHYGGMPSAHTGTMTALLTTLGIETGWNSPIFAVATVFAVLVVMDAIGLRRKISNNDALLQEQLSQKGLTPKEVMDTRFGHTPQEALVGAFMGIIIALVSLSLIS